MVKVFLSQPMKGKSVIQITKERHVIIQEVEELKGKVKIMDTIFEDFDGATPLKFLAKSLMVLADADIAYFASGWEDARGCVLEHEAAKRYGIPIMYADEPKGLGFGEALALCKSGKRITRKGWNGKGLEVVYQKAYPQGIPCNTQTARAWGMKEGDLFKCDPYLQISTVDGSHSMWVPSIRDCLANDWEVVS